MISISDESIERLTDAAYDVIRLAHNTSKDDSDFTDTMMDMDTARQIAKAVLNEYGKEQKQSVRP